MPTEPSPPAAPSLPLPPEPDELGPLTDDQITGAARILQRRNGHRYSLDDVMTAWEAASLAPAARRCLELGSGIGSVLLMLAYKLPEAAFVAIEAQRNAFTLLRENVRRNQLDGRVQLVHGDLRSETPRLEPSFDLITGTPPYVPPGAATPSHDAQKAYARQEYRGGVEAYLAAASSALAPEGIAVVCADARTPERVFAGASAAGLAVFQQREVVPRAGKGALFTVFALQRGSAAPRPLVRLPAWVARDEQGARTQAYLDVRRFFGVAPPERERPSP